MKDTVLRIDCPNCSEGHMTWQAYADCLIKEKEKLTTLPEITGETLGKALIESLREALEFQRGKKKLRTTTVTTKKKKRKKRD